MTQCFHLCKISMPAIIRIPHGCGAGLALELAHDDQEKAAALLMDRPADGPRAVKANFLICTLVQSNPHIIQVGIFFGTQIW